MLEGIISENQSLDHYIIRPELTDYREYFLTTDFRLNKESFVTLLKGFSFFKKRQQSNWKFMIVTRSEEGITQPEIAALLSNYKFRDDVVLTDTAYLNNKIKEAYAIVSICKEELFPIPIIEALRQETPVISVKKQYCGANVWRYDFVHGRYS